MHFVVQTPRIESDLTPLSQTQWEQYRRYTGFVPLDSAQDDSPGTVAARNRGGQELWLVLLVAVIVMGIGELWLTRLWSRELV